MGFQDRRYRDDPGDGGAFRRALRRIFVEGDNFFAWALPLFTFKGIRVRIHILFVLWIVIELLMSLGQGATGVGFRAAMMGSLFTMVLLHEFGHCFACRRVGGEANEITMWPLGGLAWCSPPHNWRANFITTAGGPLVNVALIPVLGGAMLLAGAQPEHLIFNPFSPGRALMLMGFGSWPEIILFYAWYTNLILLIFNLIVPMYPMDGARIIQELMWARMGYRRSMLISVNVGFVTAIAMGVFSITTRETQLLGLAIFGGMICWNEKQRLAMVDDVDYDVGRPGDYGYGPRRPAPVAAPRGRDRAYEAALKQQQRQRDEQAEVDRILAKIAEQGMGSLTRSERRILERETERKRKQSGGVST